MGACHSRCSVRSLSNVGPQGTTILLLRGLRLDRKIASRSWRLGWFGQLPQKRAVFSSPGFGIACNVSCALHVQGEVLKRLAHSDLRAKLEVQSRLCRLYPEVRLGACANSVPSVRKALDSLHTAERACATRQHMCQLLLPCYCCKGAPFCYTDALRGARGLAGHDSTHAVSNASEP